MAYWIDDAGKLREGDEEQGQRYGFRPATEEDLQAHNHALDVGEADTKGPIGLIGEGFQRGLGHVQDAARSVGFHPPIPGSEAFGTGGAIPGPTVTQPPVPAGAESFPEATSEDARLRTEAHPVWEGIGTGLAVAPLSGLAGAAAGALGGPAVLGAAVTGIAAEAVVEAAAQEWDDAWLEQRPVELKNVAAYTAMFGLGDVLLRGGGKLVKRAGGSAVDALRSLTGAPAPASTTLGARNIVAEAEGRAASATGRRPTQSVGAASASDMDEPFEEALATMDNRSAAVLARDGDDYLNLAAMHSADDYTRIERGLSTDLGSDLKYEDLAIGAEAWTPKIVNAQGQWLEEQAALGQDVVNQIRAFTKGFPEQLDFGNLGKRVALDIETGFKRVLNETDPGRRNYLADALKKTLDRDMMAIDASFGVDPVTRADLKKILRPIAGAEGSLRKGLEDRKYWGTNADIQKALNSPWHDLLEHWSAVQQKLYEATGHTKFDTMGAGRTTRESTSSKLMGIYSQDPRALREFGEHLSGALDGYTRLVEARKSHGIVKKEGLDPLLDAVRNLKEDWNLANTVQIARTRTANLERDPRNWGKWANAAEKLPMGVGSLVGAARTVGQVMGDLNLPKGTALADVWEHGLRRYARHPALGDASINQAYSDWMQAALRTRGAAIPDRRNGWGGIKDAAVAGVKDNAGKVAGVGGLAASAALGEDDNPNGAAAAGAGGLALLLGKGGMRLLKEEAAPLIGVLARQGGPDDWTTRRVRGWLKSDAPLSVRHIEHELAESFQGADGYYRKPEWGQTPELPELRAWVSDAMTRTGATEDQVIRTLVSEGSGFKPRGPRSTPRKPKGPTPPAPSVEDRTGIEGDFDDMGDQLLTPPDMKEALKDARRAVGKEGQAAFKAYQSQAGFNMNEAMRTGDFSSWGAERAGDVSAYLQNAIDSGATAPGFVVRGVELPKEEVQRLTAAKLLTAQAFVSTTPNVGIAKRFAGTAKRGNTGFRKTIGDVPVMFEIEQATGVPLSAGEVTLRPGTQFKVLAHRVERVGSKAEPKIVHVFRVRESGYAPGAKTEGLIAGGLIGLGGIAAAGNASAAAGSAPIPDREPAPSNGPKDVYRDAMSGIAQGGASIIQRKASEALRKRPPKGRSPLQVFTGRRSLDDAVDAAREAVGRLAADPSALIDHLAASVGELGTTHPSVYMAMVEKAAGIVAYLSAEAPQRSGRTLLDPEGMPPSTDQSLDFAYKVVGSLMPEQAMGDIARLDAPPEEVAAFQQHWPELWEPMRVELLGQTIRRYEAGRPVDAERLRGLDSLLGMDGQLDPSGSTAVAQQLLAAQEQAPAAGAGNSAPSGAPSGKAASMFRTRAAGAMMENQIG